MPKFCLVSLDSIHKYSSGILPYERIPTYDTNPSPTDATQDMCDTADTVDTVTGKPTIGTTTLQL